MITSIFQLAGIKDARAKIIGSNNPLNIVRATFKGLTSQVRTLFSAITECATAGLVSKATLLTYQ